MSEIARHKAFEDLVGGPNRAMRLVYIWNNSFKCGTAYDFLQGRGVTKKQNFRNKAKRDGYSENEINAFLSLS